MEYLMTYGWAILFIAIAVGVLFGLGVFTPGNSASQICQLESGFGCVNYYMVQNGLLTINILQTTSTPINITAVGCNRNSTYIPTLALSPQTYMPIGTNATFNVQCYVTSNTVAFSGQVNQVFTGYVQFNYTDTTTGFPQVIFGNIAVKIAR